jgi:hypothetical protein
LPESSISDRNYAGLGGSATSNEGRGSFDREIGRSRVEQSL